MTRRTFMHTVLLIAYFAFFLPGLIDTTQYSYEELIQKMSDLEKMMVLQQTRCSGQHEMLEARISHLDEQVVSNKRIIEHQQSEIERLKNMNQDKSTANTPEDDKQEQSRPLENQSSEREMIHYSSGKVKRSFPEVPVAFTAILDHEVQHSGIEQTVIFNKYLLNDGNAYNNHTGVFTAPKEGVYMFYLAFGAGFEAHKVWMHIVVDGHGKVSGVADTLQAGHDAQGTNLVLLHLQKGDSVWVTTYAVADVSIYGSPSFTTFSGVLLYEY